MPNTLPDHLLTVVRLTEFTIVDQEDWRGDEPWIINVFFRVDGHNSVLSEEFQLVSNPSAARTAGAHGNLNVPKHAGDTGTTWPVPEATGKVDFKQFKRIRLPNPCDDLPNDVGLGVVGLVTILFDEDGVADSAAKAGADQAVTSVRNVVHQVANTLSLANPEVDQDGLLEHQERIRAEIKQAIKSSLNLLQIFRAVDKDDVLGAKVTLFTFDELHKRGRIDFNLPFDDLTHAKYVFKGFAEGRVP